MFLIGRLRLTIFFTFKSDISQRAVIDSVEVICNKMNSQIIYELGASTGELRRFKIEVVNVDIMQQVFVI